MLNSKELWNKRKQLSEAQASCMNDGKVDEAHVIQGQIIELDATIEHVIAEEDALRASDGRNPLASKDAGPFARRILGPRDEFKPLDISFSNTAPAPVYVPGQKEIDTDLPMKQAMLLAQFAATLPESNGIGSIEYKQRGTQTGKPDTWNEPTGGTSSAKAAINYTWVDKVAIKETIAGTVPISEASLADYDELYSIIQNDLLIDLNEQIDERYLLGNKTGTGIIGVLNTEGILSWTDGAAGQYFEVIRKMRTRIMRARRVPTHVCVSPEIKEAIDLYKTETGLYQYLGDGILWGMQVVEDINCGGILCYDAFGAERKNIHGVTVKFGTVNNQFNENEITMRAEATKALKVKIPEAFCYGTKADIDKAVA